MEQGTLTPVVVVRRGVQVVRVALTPLERLDLASVDQLARLGLAAYRVGCTIRVCGAPRELVRLLDLVGLGGLAAVELAVEAGRQPEGPEQVGVEEVVVPDDPVT